MTANVGRTDEITYWWNNGKSSTITFKVTNVVRAANGTTTVTSLGAVTDGLGKGSVATRVVVLPALSLTACDTTGVEQEVGLASLSIPL
ncbi:hypothetical protein ABZ746_33865 [Streptomyces sp. NPDC020096]